MSRKKNPEELTGNLGADTERAGSGIDVSSMVRASTDDELPARPPLREALALAAAETGLPAKSLTVPVERSEGVR